MQSLNSRSVDQKFVDLRQERYVFDPAETVPEVFTDNDQLLIKDQGEQYSLRVEERRAPVETYKITATSVAGSQDQFDQWFMRKHVVSNIRPDSLSAQETEILQQATRDSVSEQSPFSKPLSSMLQRLEANEGSSGRQVRYVRHGGELKQATISKAIGC